MQAEEADEDRTAAFHEAGHAVAAWAQCVGLDYATIGHEEGATGRIALQQESGLLGSVAGMERLIRISLAGPIAQQRACGDAGIDQEKAGADMIIVRALFLVISGGKIDSFPKFIARLTAETEALIFQPMSWARMLAVADALVERRMLTGQELAEVIKAVPIGSIRRLKHAPSRTPPCNVGYLHRLPGPFGEALRRPGRMPAALVRCSAVSVGSSFRAASWTAAKDC